MKRIIALAVLVTLCGCRSPEEVLARRNALDDAQCKSYGVIYGTPEYANCRQFLVVQRANADAQAQASLNSAAAMFSQVGQPHYANGIPVNSGPQFTSCTQQGAFFNCLGQ